VRILNVTLFFQCIHTSLANKNHCIDPPKKDIPGFEKWIINKTLSVSKNEQIIRNGSRNDRVSWKDGNN
jgi:hypothetical protein